MALPTTNLTLHVDASDTDNLFTTANGGGAGVHTGTPADSNAVQVWDDEGDGIADVAFVYASNGAVFRSSTPLMLDSCLDVDQSVEQYYVLKNQAASSNKALSDIATNSAFTILLSMYVEEAPASGANLYDCTPVITSNARGWGIWLKDHGSSVYKAHAYVYDGGIKEIGQTISLSTSYVVTARLSGGTLYVSLDGGSETSVASGNVQTMATNVELMKSAAGGVGYKGRIGEIAVYSASLSGGDWTDARNYFTSKWLGSGGASAEGGGMLLGSRRNRLTIP